MTNSGKYSSEHSRPQIDKPPFLYMVSEQEMAGERQVRVVTLDEEEARHYARRRSTLMIHRMPLDVWMEEQARDFCLSFWMRVDKSR